MQIYGDLGISLIAINDPWVLVGGLLFAGTLWRWCVIGEDDRDDSNSESWGRW